MFQILIYAAIYLTAVVAVCTGLYAQVSGHGGKSPWSGIFGGNNYELSVHPPSIRVCGTLKPTLSIDDCRDLRELFEKRRFDALNKIASEIQLAFEHDPSYEYKACDFYGIFGSSLPEYEELLNAWVAHSPSHFAPHLARAEYYYYRGWECRGQKYASETSRERFGGMRSFFQKAMKDIDAALAMNPRLLSAHILRISIYNVDGENYQEDGAFDEARQYFPNCFLLYNTMAWSKLPRWGGSYPEMDKIAMQAYERIKSNPELYMLFGRIYADQAWGCRQNKQYDKAIALYSKAIRYGEYYEFFVERAQTFIEMEKYDQALKDVDRSISLRPIKPRPYCTRVSVLMHRGDPDAVVSEIRSMEAMFPGDFEIRDWKDWAAGWSLNQGHKAFKRTPEQAVAWYGRAIEMKPEYQEAYYWRGIASWKMNNADLAYSNFEQAIRLDPHDFKSYKMMDDLLASQQRWDEIIEHWNGYLGLEPNNGDAYLERAGANRHKGDMQSALADLRSACNLGNKQACGILKQYR